MLWMHLLVADSPRPGLKRQTRGVMMALTCSREPMHLPHAGGDYRSAYGRGLPGQFGVGAQNIAGMQVMPCSS